jgi:peptide/nickel transport system permease protein
MVGLIMVFLVVIITLISPWISPYDPISQDMNVQHAPPSWAHPFGTDSYGRDQLSRILWGSRVSLVVGTLSVLFAMAAGIPLGMIGGYKGGRIDNLVLRFIDIFMSFPIVILGLLVLAIMGPGLIKIVIAIGVALTPRIARLARGSTLSVKGKEYIEAARAVGQGDGKIMIIHVLPNISGEILVMGTLWVATAIIVEASLSFIGLGVRPPTPSWGAMIRDGLDQLTNAPWLSIFPGLAIFFSVFSFNLIADGLRDISDPKLRG